ncbi:Cytoplasmic tRNA 2-thiolation protein 2, partial [Nowakowskiella sp. JEL0078]
MCDSIESDLNLNLTKNSTVIIDKSKRICGKCRIANPVVYVRRAYYCKPCFRDSVVHRFRTVLQKKVLLPDDQKVLLAFSGGPSSCTMLNLIHDYHSQNGRKRQKFAGVIVCHIDESVLGFQDDVMIRSVQHIQTLVEQAGLPFIRIPLERVFESKNIFSSISTSAIQMTFNVHEGTPAERLKYCLEGITKASYREDLINHFRFNLLLAATKEQNCKGLLLGCNATRLAIRIISQTSKGRGFALPVDIATETDFYKEIVILRPLKDVLAKEIGIFNHYEKIRPAIIPNELTKSVPKSSIDKLTEDFITSLQQDFPSTVSTIYRTMHKITTEYNQPSSTHCSICSGPVQDTAHSWRNSHTVQILPVETSIQATTCAHGTKNSLSSELEVQEIEDWTRTICYSCQNLKADRDIKRNLILPEYVGRRVHNTADERRRWMHDEVKDYIIND